ncbi:hypothetical protein ACFQU2_22245 [Siccirubricoccus deserti]
MVTPSPSSTPTPTPASPSFAARPHLEMHAFDGLVMEDVPSPASPRSPAPPPGSIPPARCAAAPGR